MKQMCFLEHQPLWFMHDYLLCLHHLKNFAKFRIFSSAYDNALQFKSKIIKKKCANDSSYPMKKKI